MSIESAANELARRIQPPEDRLPAEHQHHLWMRMGKVTGTSGTSVVVQLGGATSTLTSKRLATYTPTVGDIVFVLMWDGNMLVLGKAA